MKKTLILLFVFTSTLMFVFVNLSFEEKDVSDIYWNFGLNERPQTTLEFDGDLRDFDFDYFVNIIKQIHEETGVTIVTNDFDYSNHDYNYYVLSNTPLDDLFNLSISPVVLDKVDTDNHLSTDSNINLINGSIDLDIYSYRYIIDHDVYPSVGFYYEEIAQLNTVEKMVNDNLKDYQPVFIDYGQDAFDYKSEIKTQVLYLLILSIFLLFSSLLFLISTNLRQIGIYKLQGFSSALIVNKLIIKEIIFSVILSLFVVSVIFILRIGFITTASLEMLKIYFQYFSLLIGVMLLLTFFFIGVIKVLRLSDIIKGRNLNKYFASLIYITKILAILVIFPVIVQKIPSTVNAVKQIKEVSKHEGIYNSIQSIPGFKNYIRTYETTFPEISNETENMEYLKHQSMLEDFQKEGAFYLDQMYLPVDPRDPSQDIIALETDINYLKHDFGLENYREEVETLLIDNDLVVLIDHTEYESKKQDTLKHFFKSQDIVFVPIEMPSNIFTNQKDFSNIVIIYNIEMPRVDKTIFNNVYLYDFDNDKIESLLKEYEYSEMLNIMDYRHVPEMETSYLKELLIEDGFNLTMSSLIYLVISYSFYVAYKRTKHQTIYVQRLHGYPLYYIYLDYAIESLLSYSILFILIKDHSFINLIIIMELLIYLVIFIESKVSLINVELKKEVIT